MSSRETDRRGMRGRLASAEVMRDHETSATQAIVEVPHTDIGAARQAPSRRRWTRRVRVTRTLVSVLAVAAVAVLLARPVTPETPSSSGVVTLTPGADALECVRDAAWSPDGRYAALLGTSGGCSPLPSNAHPAVGHIVVYDAKSGAVHARYSPDRAILDAFHTALPTAGDPLIQYQTLLWRHDGAQLAVAFTVTSAGQTDQVGNGQTMLGVYLIGAGSASARVLTHVLAPGEDGTGEWNLREGRYLARPVVLHPAALTYSWSGNGTLTPGAPVSTAATTTPVEQGAVGTPDGDTTFSLWQPAEVMPESNSTADTSTDAAHTVYVYRTSFAGWSPDGTYFVPSMGLSARVQPAGQPAPDSRTLRALGAYMLPQLTLRDAALSTALGRLSLVSPDRSNGPMLAAWSLDGRMLAVQLIPAEPNANPSRADHAIIVYDCATGKPLTALVPRLGPQRLAGDTLMRWSPDGTHLLLYDAAFGTLMLWGPGSVPAAPVSR